MPSPTALKIRLTVHHHDSTSWPWSADSPLLPPSWSPPILCIWCDLTVGIRLRTVTLHKAQVRYSSWRATCLYCQVHCKVQTWNFHLSSLAWRWLCGSAVICCYEWYCGTWIFLLCLKRRNLHGLTHMKFVRENCILPPNTWIRSLLLWKCN